MKSLPKIALGAWATGHVEDAVRAANVTLTAEETHCRKSSA